MLNFGNYLDVTLFITWSVYRHCLTIVSKRTDLSIKRFNWQH